jgi:imidazole glycerol-phosphate synthase subunit HisF
MLKVRVIPTLLMREVNLVKGPAFDSWRAVGAPMQSVKVFNRRDVDELVLLDIAATPGGRGPDVAIVATLARECFVPLTVGGGVTSTNQIRDLLRAGADKVSINTAAYSDQDLISQAADAFGSQCVVAAIDYRTHPDAANASAAAARSRPAAIPSNGPSS